MTKLRVYGGMLLLNGNPVHGIMAGTQVEVAKATNSTLSYIRNYWAETGNAKELEIALKNPGVLFWCNSSFSEREYKRVKVSDMIKW